MATTRKAAFKTPSKPRGKLAPTSATALTKSTPAAALATSLASGSVPDLSAPALLDTADTTAAKLAGIAPTFGEILKSVGSGVALSQRGLDESVRDVVKSLSDTKIDVITEVVQRIDDDTGLPLEPTADDLVKQRLSVLNFVTPTVHEWKYVALSMDMTVAGMDAKSGMVFDSAGLSASRTSSGLFFGFIGVGSTNASADFRDVRSNVHRETEWAAGSVQMDAMLGPRRTTRLPVPATVDIGPQIFVAQGRTAEKKNGDDQAAVLVERNVEVSILVLKADGSPNVGVVPTIEATGLMRELTSAEQATDEEGKVAYRLHRFFNGGANGFSTFPITVKLGDIVRRFAVDL